MTSIADGNLKYTIALCKSIGLNPNDVGALDIHMEGGGEIVLTVKVYAGEAIVDMEYDLMAVPKDPDERKDMERWHEGLEKTKEAFGQTERSLLEQALDDGAMHTGNADWVE